MLSVPFAHHSCFFLNLRVLGWHYMVCVFYMYLEIITGTSQEIPANPSAYSGLLVHIHEFPIPEVKPLFPFWIHKLHSCFNNRTLKPQIALCIQGSAHKTKYNGGRSNAQQDYNIGHTGRYNLVSDSPRWLHVHWCVPSHAGQFLTHSSL